MGLCGEVFNPCDRQLPFPKLEEPPKSFCLLFGFIFIIVIRDVDENRHIGGGL